MNGSYPLPSHLAPYPASQQAAYPAAGMQASHPSIPPKSALRVNTDFGRTRSASSAVPGSRPIPKPLEIVPVYGTNHQFSRSLSHASPLVPEGSSLQQATRQVPSASREGRDVFMAVQNLRGASQRSLSPTSPMRAMTAIPEPAPRSGASGSGSGGTGMGPDDQYTDAIDAGETTDEEHEIQSDTVKKIQAALAKSSDGGNTLDLSRRGIQHIGPAAVEIFRKSVGQEGKGVWRLALSYNALRDDGIDISFTRLGRLRYLNLKGNNFTSFPTALTDMPSLEILDLSKNRLSSFPNEPGRLVRLKVLSLSSNKIYTLPSYLTRFDGLKVFKVDNNPVEWPPKEVLGALIDGELAIREREDTGGKEKKREEDLRPWIENMKSWMRQRAADTDRLMERSLEEQIYPVPEELTSPARSQVNGVASETLDSPPESPNTRVASQQTIRPWREGTPGRSASPAASRSARPGTGGRSRSTNLSNEVLVQTSPIAQEPSTEIIPTHSRSPSVTSPPPSAISQTTSIHSRQSSTDLPTPPTIPAISHNRGASYTATQRLSASLASKKSLPDLRQSHAKIMQDRREPMHLGEDVRPLGLGISSPPSRSTRFAPQVPSWSAASLDMAKSPSSAYMSGGKDHSRTLGRKGSADMLRRPKGSLGAESMLSDKRNSQEGPMVDDSRNSYFRRLSTLPVSSISKGIPDGLLRCVDAIRGILFALSQLHSALKQYLVFAASDRVASLFSRVMEPAAGHMSALINALDRFDSMSRRGTPPVAAIRGVLESTRDSITTFAKVVAVLRLQMPALKGSDVRYTRTLLLMIYGSMAEVSYSWTAIAPLLAEIKVLLMADSLGLPNRAILGGTKMAPSASFLGRTPISPIPERGESHSPPSVARSERTEKPLGASPLAQSVSAVESSPTPATAPSFGGAATGRSGNRSRRQAGSFSTQDVERGMKMGGSPNTSRDFDLGASGGGGFRRHQSSGSSHSLLTRMDESDAENEASMLSALDDEELDSMLPNPPFALRAGMSNSSSSTSHLPQTPPDHHAALQPIAMVPTSSHHSRRGHHPSSSSGSSHMIQPYGLAIPRKLSVDIRPPTPISALHNTAQLDESLLNQVESAIEVAFTAWLRIAEDVGASSPPNLAATTNASGLAMGHHKSGSQSSLSSGPYTPVDSRRPSTISPKHYAELLDLLSSSEQITSTLRECLMAIRANPASSSGTAVQQLQSHAQAFVKTVVKVTELIMNISATHSFPMGVKSCCAKLVQFTREFAILFSVANMRPGTSASTRTANGGSGGGRGGLGSAPLSARSTSPMPFSARSASKSSLSLNHTGSGHASASATSLPFHRSKESLGYIGAGSGPESSNEDLVFVHPSSASSGSWSAVTALAGAGGGPPSGGLRGLQLPTRQAALAKKRAGGVPAR